MQEQDKPWQDGDFSGISEVKAALELRAKENREMHSFNLVDCDLEGIDLVHHHSKTGYSLTNADLYRTNLRNANCFMLDLSGSSMRKADFSNANLHCANLEDCNLLGTKLDGAKLDHARWGNMIIQEKQAIQCPSYEQKMELYQQAEEIYRGLRNIFEAQGVFDMAGFFFEREMVVRRKQLPKYSARRFFSKLIDLFSGYGEQPLRVILFSFSVILLFASIYFFSGLQTGGEIIRYNPELSHLENIKTLSDCLYFSIVTFTTLGYGDVSPIGVSRIFAATEALIGSFSLALFVVVVVKKMTR